MYTISLILDPPMQTVYLRLVIKHRSKLKLENWLVYLVFAVIELECHVKGWINLKFDIVTLATAFP